MSEVRGQSLYFGFGISDLSFGLPPFGRVPGFGFLTTIDDIEFNSSDFAIGSLVLTSFSGNFQSAFCNRRFCGTPFFFALAGSVQAESISNFSRNFFSTASGTRPVTLPPA